MSKYREFDIFEIENGWILKIFSAIDPHGLNQEEFLTIHFKDFNTLIVYLTEVESNG